MQRPRLRDLLLPVSALAAVVLAPRPAAQLGLSTEINQAIDRGIQRLLAWQDADGSFGGAGHAGRYPMGQTALAAYTLLRSGLDRDDPAIQRAFAHLRGLELAKVYSVSCWVLAMDAARDPELAPEIRRSAAWLEGCFNARDDLWGYPDGDPELSNTQFAVLALWTAGRHGYEPDPRLWADLIDGARDLQNDDGGFGYKPTDRPYSHGSMTTAGITTLAIARDALRDDARYGKAVRAADEALERGWSWMDRHFTLTGNPTSDTGLLLDRHRITTGRLHMFHYYYVWGVERIAAICDRDAIGGRDWYREGVVQLLREEEVEGGWKHLDTTAFALLFLRRATYSGLAGREQEASIPRAVTWRYTTERPPEGWEEPAFDDSGWKVGAGGFGNFQNAYRQDRTAWEGVDVWLRREFRWDRDPGELRLVTNHDDGVEIYLNGVLAASSAVFSAMPKEYAVAAEARATLAPEGNVIAVHCHDDGGARTVDVAFVDRGGLAARLGTALAPEPRPWMQRPPGPEVPYLRRWLTCGPIDDRRHAEFPDEPIRAGELRPVAGERSRGQVWRASAARGALVDLAEDGRDAAAGFRYALTYLHVDADVNAVLWLGASDGVRAWLDGRLVLSHHAHGPALRDELPLPLRLTAGVHALMVRVERAPGSAGPTGLYARLADLDGRTPAGVRPALSPDEPDWAASARAQPGFFGLPELAARLEADGREVQDFDRDDDVAALCVEGAADGLPRWEPGAGGRRRADGAAVQPNPGRRGLAVVAPAADDRPARLYRRVRVPALGPWLVVTYAPACAPPPAEVDKAVAPDPAAPGGVRLALWAWRDGELVALGEDRATATAAPDRKAWRRFEADLAPVAGEEVLLILEVHADGAGPGAGVATLDDVVLEQR